MHDKQAVNPKEIYFQSLIENLKNEDWEIRTAATETLSKSGDSRAVEPLIECLNDEYSYMRVLAAKALLTIGLPTLSFLNDALKNKPQEVKFKIIQILQEIGIPAIPFLIAAFKSQNDAVCAKIMTVLLTFGESAVPSLIEALKDNNANIRSFSASTLGWKDNLKAVEPLIQALSDENSEVRACRTCIG